MDNFVITIARQYGSGGRTIGEELAKKLGISYYDKDIIRMASEESGIHEQLFEGQMKMSAIKQRFCKVLESYKGELIPPQSKDFTSDENLFNYQAKVIRQLAETESCVIIGRCANMILKDYSNVLQPCVCLMETGDFVSARQARSSAEPQRTLRNSCIKMTNAKKISANDSWVLTGQT